MWFIFELLHNFVKKVVYNAKSHDVIAINFPIVYFITEMIQLVLIKLCQ